MMRESSLAEQPRAATMQGAPARHARTADGASTRLANGLGRRAEPFYCSFYLALWLYAAGRGPQ